MELSWEPVRKGLIYCAPACGRGCKITEYDRAMLRANDLAKRMGAGWTTRVWENLGWFYEVQSPSGQWIISPSHYNGKLSYMVRLGGCITGQSWSAVSDDLKKAVEAVKRSAKDDLAKIVKAQKAIHEVTL